MKNKDYKIGLDIGTNSVGWAVIDKNNSLVRYKKQNMWGVRLFSEAQKAEERRIKRSARRRLARRNYRLRLLQQLFSQAVLEKDDAFFIRMKESMLWNEDKTTKGDFQLFNDADFTDKDFHQQYPTIYHLRHELANSNSQKDARLVYLALHHILKNRGNFLYEKDFNIDSLEDITKDIEDLFCLLGKNNDNIILKTEQKLPIIKTLKKQTISRDKKRKEILVILNPDRNIKPLIENTLKLLLGLKSDFSKIFPEIEFGEEKDAAKFEFNEKFDEKRDELAAILGENFDLIEICEKIYSWIILQSILNGKKSLSEAMIDKYNSHHKDLALLKKITKNEDIEAKNYDTRKRFFNEIYQEYIRNTSDLAKRKQNSSAYKVLENEIRELLKIVPDKYTKEKEEILQKLDLGTFLPKLRTSDNGKIPHQLHKTELEKIINNQARFYPELAQNKDKIIKLLEFRIPYYVGPLIDNSKVPQGQKNNFAWMQLKTGEKGEILPWNFDQKVDKLASAENFITRMTNSCTYLLTEPVLPKNSLIYSEFNVRNEINNLRINDKRIIDLQLREKIFNEFLTRKSFSKSALIKFLKQNNFPEEIVDIKFANDKGFSSNLAPIIDFRNIGIEIDLQNKCSANFKMAENIIRWIVLFGENKSILKAKIREKYANILSETQISNLSNLRYTGWGRLSEKLLIGLKTSGNNEVDKNILEMMQKTGKNFIQIINEKDLKAKIEAIQSGDFSGQITYETIQNLAGSPGIKRGIWQSLKIIDEIVDIMGHEPESIAIEMARENQKSRRTKSRKSQIEQLYKKADSFIEIDDKIKNQLYDEGINLNNDRIMLYFLQNGKCAYSGNPLELSDLSKTTQIDHIIPQHLIKDNSFSNRVLVLNDYNQKKSGDLIVPIEWRQNMLPTWRQWLKAGLISQQKFARLTHKEEDRESLERGFINRQLVETRQITKHVAQILAEKFSENCKIRLIKANLTSQLRNKFNWPKMRELNDFHHAKDAYLAAVLSNFLQIRFPQKDREYNYGEFVYKTYRKYIQQNNEQKKQTSREENSFLVAMFDRDGINKQTGEILWSGKDNLGKVARTIKFNDCLITKKLEENTGGFYDITILSKKEAQKIAQKGKLLSSRKIYLEPTKYGGFSGEKGAYSIALEFDGKKDREKRIVNMPVQFIKNPKKYLDRNFNNYRILYDKILKNQLIIRDGSPQYLTSYQEVNNARQLKIPYKFENFIANLSKILSKPNVQVGDNDFMVFATQKLSYKIEFDRKNPEFSTEQRNFIKDDISRRLNELYKLLTQKGEENFPVFTSEIKKLKECQEKFEQLEISDKYITIVRFLKLLHTDASIVDFDNIGYRKNVGQKQIPGGVKIDNLILIHQSITGLKTKRIKL